MSSHQPDQYYGKILTPSNYSVVQGIFAHSEPEFKDDEYDLLKDSFGLIDKSPERWIKFERCVVSSCARTWCATILTRTEDISLN